MKTKNLHLFEVKGVEMLENENSSVAVMKLYLPNARCFIYDSFILDANQIEPIANFFKSFGDSMAGEDEGLNFKNIVGRHGICLIEDGKVREYVYINGVTEVVNTWSKYSSEMESGLAKLKEMAGTTEGLLESAMKKKEEMEVSGLQWDDAIYDEIEG